MTTYQMTVKAKVIVGFNINAETPEEAMKIGREKLSKKFSYELPNIEILDGNETILGVGELDWDLN